MYKKVSSKLNFVDNENEVLKFWNENEVFEKSIDDQEGHPDYTFYDGPPTANGKPHIGHVLTRVIKDMVPRYQTMKGHKIIRKGGWDTHGLPVELEVEKLIGISGKPQIESYGIEPFIKKCKESVWKYKGMWQEFSDKVGFWAYMDDPDYDLDEHQYDGTAYDRKPYVTYHNDYIESEWWALKTMWDQGKLYKGFKVVPYCPRCGTPLSSHEVAQGYKTIKDRTAIVRFKVANEDAYFLAWTTTPWTLPSNIALCVNPNDEYVKVKAVDGYTYYMAKALLDNVLGQLLEAKDKEGNAKFEAFADGKAYEILETYKGSDLEYKEYEPLYEGAKAMADKQHKKAFFVYCDDYVTMTDGTGIVHIAPAFGEDDARVGRKYDAPFVQMVDAQGCMKPEAGKFAGMRAKPTEKEIEEGAVSCDPEVLKDLSERSILFAAPVAEHDYPHCWRCDTPLIYYARESWFIKMTDYSDEMVANNNTVNWIPEGIGHGRFGEWLKNVQDWGISRDRYWGTPLNVWECPDCGKRHAIGSIQEMLNLATDETKALLASNPEKFSSNPKRDVIELHRPYVDMVKIKCDDCGHDMQRVQEVIDCWFDSGAMPFAQWHYPFENKDQFEAHFPADFISEAVDQTRGWFYSLMAESTVLFHKAPFKNVIVLGHVQDANGQKMSKSKGNAVDPMDALNKYGADAIRWYFYTNSQPWLPNKFHEKAVTEGQRKFLGTLWNTYAFYVLYADIDNFNPTQHTLEYDKLSVMDKWLLSKLNTAVKECDANMSAYKIPESAAVLSEFVDEMSNWYVRRSRDRYWAKGMEQDKINAYMTLYTALVTISKAAAPMIPFMTEAIYQNLVRSVDETAPISIHLCSYPEVEDKFIDKDLENAMDEVVKIVVLGRAARNASAIKNRQPVAALFVNAPTVLDSYYVDVIADELNAKTVEFKDDLSEFSSYSFKPQLRTVGPKYGKLLGGIKTYLSDIDGVATKKELDANGSISFDVNGETVTLTAEDLLIEASASKDFDTQQDGAVTVVLDKRLTPELIEEGYVREIISKVQSMRKEADFEVTDRITVYMTNNDKLAEIVTRNADMIKAAVLADYIQLGEMKGFTKEWDINGEEVVLGVAR